MTAALQPNDRQALARFGVVRVTANNGGPFTGAGTNTYVIGDGIAPRMVVDPGPLDRDHLAAILGAANGNTISHVLVTHAHRDHVDGLARLRDVTGARVFGFGRVPSSPGTAPPPDSRPSGGDFIDDGVRIDHLVRHGDVIRAAGTELTAVHTPGHAPDHLCFALRGTPILFSGDHVMGWSTSVIAPPEGHMGHYLSSLERLLGRPETTYLPGHGDPVHDGHRTVKAYLLHRQMRERAILDCARRGGQTVGTITDTVYAGIAATLVDAARLSVQAHLEHLAEKGLVSFGAPLANASVIVTRLRPPE